MGVLIIPHPENGAQVYEITCDGDPHCLESGYMTGSAGINFALVAQTYRLYGWVIVVHQATPSKAETTAEAWCPAHHPEKKDELRTADQTHIPYRGGRGLPAPADRGHGRA